MAAPAHGGVLLGDREQLEPDTLHLERAGEHLRREGRDVGAPVQHLFQFRIVPPGDIDQGVEQDVERVLRRCARDHGRREGVP
jgi:hypothetical protein